MSAEDKQLSEAIDTVAVADGVSPTAVPGVGCVRYAATNSLHNQRWRACLAVVAQGTKELILGDATFRLSAGSYTVTPIPLALTSRIRAAPFGAVLVSLSPALLSRMVAEMDAREASTGEPSGGIFVGKVDAHMRRALTRLAAIFGEREAGRVLGEGYIRELLFHLLRGQNGPAIRRFVRAGSAEHRVYAATHRIEAELASPLDIDALAAATGVSRTVFYAQFKRITSLSPIQFQKRLRLLKAQRLMVDEGTTAEDAAFRVGYQSPSQFSRDYARLFGEPPMRNATRLRTAAAST